MPKKTTEGNVSILLEYCNPSIQKTCESYFFLKSNVNSVF